jgi:hypothetical protein
MGTPPPLVVHQSKAKALKTWMEVPTPLSNEEKWLIDNRMAAVINDIPNYVFEGLDTKAAITLTTSACIEKSRREGGGTQAISDMIAEGEFGRKANMIDLTTGQLIKLIEYDKTNSGDYIFWRCLEEVLSMPAEKLREAFVAIVREPGKARTVTKGPIALRIVLDVINKIASFPLKKLKTSTAGMSKDAHGWQMFKAFFESENAKEAFNISATSEERHDRDAEMWEETRIYDDLFVEFTDYETATDSFHHEVGETIMKRWLSRVGLPPLLKRIAHGIIPKPRKIIFEGTGIFSDIGEPYGETTRFVILRAGFLMGDYLSKVILHLQNASTRKIGRFLTDPTSPDFIGSHIPGFDPKIDLVRTPFAVIDTRFPRPPSSGFGEEGIAMADISEKFCDYLTNQEVGIEPLDRRSPPGGMKFIEREAVAVLREPVLRPRKLKYFSDPETREKLKPLIIPKPVQGFEYSSPKPVSPPIFEAREMPDKKVKEIFKTFPFPWPNVITSVICKPENLQGTKNRGSGDIFDIGFIPKEARNIKDLRVRWIIKLAGRQHIQEVPEWLGPNPEDNQLMSLGLRPVNPFRPTKVYINSLDDWEQFRRDLKSYRGEYSNRDKKRAMRPQAPEPTEVKPLPGLLTQALDFLLNW